MGGEATADNNSNNETLNAILAGVNGCRHVLNLYAPSVNKYVIQAAFLSEKRGASVYVTGEKPESVQEQFDSLNAKLSIAHPFQLAKIKQYKNVVIDAATINPKLGEKKPVKGLKLKKQTIHKRRILGQSEIIKSYVDPVKRENYLNGLKQKPRILCTYDMSLLTPDKIKYLVQSHDKLILTTDDTMLLSSKSFSSKNLKLNEKKVEQFVKNELETIILALVSSSSMCGNDIKKTIYEKFSILLSSGTLYPLLHKLEKQGLLKCEYGVKTKLYKALDEKEIKKLLNESIQTKSFLSGFIRHHARLEVAQK